MTEGQTIYIYVSTGPDIVEVTMPNVVGYELSVTKEMMTRLGFTNVRYEPTESQKPEGEVVYQSVMQDEVVDASSEVIIHYSIGLQETVAPTAEPTVPEETQQETTSFTASFLVPERDAEYRLDICVGGTQDVVESRMIAPGTTSVLVEVAGSGTMSFDLYVDGVFERTQKVG